MKKRCPTCGTIGNVWNKNPEIFQCPNCLCVYSEYGMVLEPESDNIEFWN